MFPPVEAELIRDLASQLDLGPSALEETVAAFNASVCLGTFNSSELDDCVAKGLEPPKSYWARVLDSPRSTDTRSALGSRSPAWG